MGWRKYTVNSMNLSFSHSHSHFLYLCKCLPSRLLQRRSEQMRIECDTMQENYRV
jgi:hypothetical protein